MTREQAVILAESDWWERVDYVTLVGFQLFEERLCMDFSYFHNKLEKVFGRPIFTHEIGLLYDDLCREFLSKHKRVSLDDLLKLDCISDETKRLL